MPNVAWIPSWLVTISDLNHKFYGTCTLSEYRFFTYSLSNVKVVYFIPFFRGQYYILIEAPCQLLLVSNAYIFAKTIVWL